jgi:hypothetical protein
MVDQKEVTALRTIKGLRYKFAREKSNMKHIYTAFELHIFMDSLIKKIENNQTINIFEAAKPADEVWDVVDDQIERSKIKRYPWKKVIGRSLTQEILFLKKKGLNVKETFEKLINDQRIESFIIDHESEAKNILKNIEISVHARYGENNTANKVMEREE